MLKPASQKLTSWLITRPALFAITSFVLISVISFLCALTIGQLLPGIIATTITGAAITLGFLTSIVILVRGLPAQNLDRRSFVAITTLQTLICAITAIMTTLMNVVIYQRIFMYISSPVFIVISTLIALFYIYVLGIFIGSLYAKYRRIRAMGVPMWRILCTIPFGFSMLWIPGYMLPAPTPKTPTLPIRPNAYARLIDWIISRPANTAIGFIALTLLSGFFFGFKTIIFTFAIAVTFTIWVIKTGAQKFREHIAGAYTWAAIGLNIILWIAMLILVIHLAHHSTLITMTTATPIQAEQII